MAGEVVRSLVQRGVGLGVVGLNLIQELVWAFHSSGFRGLQLKCKIGGSGSITLG